mmetsp:Transcript_71242/g.231453  ORF Transcript_71242/g.231453 Transcript_71242/m.231453 type:complete len:219 (-) Transcript_71242:1288-1944(-)
MITLVMRLMMIKKPRIGPAGHSWPLIRRTLARKKRPSNSLQRWCAKAARGKNLQPSPRHAGQHQESFPPAEVCALASEKLPSRVRRCQLSPATEGGAAQTRGGLRSRPRCARTSCPPYPPSHHPPPRRPPGPLRRAGSSSSGTKEPSRRLPHPPRCPRSAARWTSAAARRSPTARGSPTAAPPRPDDGSPPLPPALTATRALGRRPRTPQSSSDPAER